jgi:alanine racemase
MKHDEYGTLATIDLSAISDNLEYLYGCASVPLLPVIKANAYGHGAIEVAKEICKKKFVEALSIFSLSEGEELRSAGIKKRIILLGGVLSGQEKKIAGLDLEPVISSYDEAARLSKVADTQRKIKVHFKIDTGMRRLGFEPENAFDDYRKISRLGGITIAGIMTHLADASAGDESMRQFDLFDDFTTSLQGAGFTLPPRHCANSAATILHKRSRYDLVRPGIAVYGISPLARQIRELKPAMRLSARIIATRTVAKNERVSYGGTWSAKRKSRLATVSIGYSDGYSRALSNNSVGLTGGRKVKQVGTICMDSTLFDISNVAARPGDTIVLLGSDGKNSITAEELAIKAGRIPYEIVCGIGRRVPRIYLRNGRKVKLVDYLTGH